MHRITTAKSEKRMSTFLCYHHQSRGTLPGLPATRVLLPSLRGKQRCHVQIGETENGDNGEKTTRVEHTTIQVRYQRLQGEAQTHWTTRLQ